MDYGINTTNGCEIFHRHFGAGSLSPHPNMFDWLAHLHASHRRHLIKANGARPISKKAHNLHLHLKNLEKREMRLGNQDEVLIKIMKDIRIREGQDSR